MADIKEAFIEPIDLVKEQETKELEKLLQPIPIIIINDMDLTRFPIFCPVCRPGIITQVSNDGNRQQFCSKCNQNINMSDYYVAVGGYLYIKG